MATRTEAASALLDSIHTLAKDVSTKPSNVEALRRASESILMLAQAWQLIHDPGDDYDPLDSTA